MYIVLMSCKAQSCNKLKYTSYRVGLAQLVVCPPLARQVVRSPPGQVIPKTIIKMVQTASLHGTQCVRVGV